jgi:hypothetical protein
MAQHNPGSRAFLLIVLGGIVVGFVIAAYVLGGDDGESGVAHQTEPAATEDHHDSGMAAEQPAASGGTAPQREMSIEEGMSDGVTPPPEEIPMDDGSRSDGVTPPEEQTPEQAVPENPPLLPNP